MVTVLMPRHPHPGQAPLTPQTPPAIPQNCQPYPITPKHRSVSPYRFAPHSKQGLTLLDCLRVASATVPINPPYSPFLHPSLTPLSSPIHPAVDPVSPQFTPPLPQSNPSLTSSSPRSHSDITPISPQSHPSLTSVTPQSCPSHKASHTPAASPYCST